MRTADNACPAPGIRDALRRRAGIGMNLQTTDEPRPAAPGFRIFIQIAALKLFIRPELQCALVADHENSLAMPEINPPDLWRTDNNQA
jgi:hypothetical protein